jgi:hypothetical protein
MCDASEEIQGGGCVTLPGDELRVRMAAAVSHGSRLTMHMRCATASAGC